MTMQETAFGRRPVGAGHASCCHEPLRNDGGTLPRDRDGYCHISRRIAGRIVRRAAHRLAYEAAGGELRPGFVLDHLCRNRWCCNPQHLEQVLQADNVRRGGASKLTEDAVQRIRAAGGLTQAELAVRFGVSQSAISRAVRGEQWAGGPCPAWAAVKRSNELRRTCHL